MINNNIQINNIQKYHYLRASLTGTAQSVIQSFDFTHDNYSIAWSTLCDRFNNTELLVQNHLKAICGLEIVGDVTSGKIRHFYETYLTHLSNLKRLGETTESWDTLLIYILKGKLDKGTASEWQRYKSNHTTVTLKEFTECLKKRANLLETFESNMDQNNDRKNNTSKNVCTSNQNVNSKYVCYLCKGDHRLFYCPDFHNMAVKDRVVKAKSMKVCLNCLKKNHTSADCRWSGCKICNMKHNTMLHVSSDTAASSELMNQDSVNTIHCTLATAKNGVLSTAQVEAYNNTNWEHKINARALLDCGSQSSFITTSLCERLTLTKTKHKLAVSGIDNKLTYANYKCDVKIKSIVGSYSFTLSCFVLDKITANIPDVPIDSSYLNIPVNIQLADPDFDTPQSIDILIGANAFWDLLSQGRISLGAHLPVLHNTHLGWVIAGAMDIPVSKSHCNLSTNIAIQDQLTKFWEVEEVSTKKPWSVEENLCEEHFLDNLTTSVAYECEVEHPNIAKIIRNDMYVDDLLTCVDTEQEANYIISHITQIFLQRGFELRKWKSNDKNVLSDIDIEHTSNIVEFSANKGHETKTLGLFWKCDQDTLTYKINVNNSHSGQMTKRIILSRISTIFDPLGLVSPCIITAKVQLQKLWLENLTWDQPLPNNILTSWLEFSTDLDQLNDLLIKRKVTCYNYSQISLHGFADASESSYGACIYVVSRNANGDESSNLLCAKSKVAPLKSLTMPRLELCAALVLAQLTSKVRNSLDIGFDNVYCWSDSTIVLGWLHTSPNLLKPFVSNRVAEIQRLTETVEWRHVPTFDNPADIVSRGLSPKRLLQSDLWFHGPTWLTNPDDWPIMPTSSVELPEKRKLCILSTNHQAYFPFERFSSLTKLKRSFAFILRFIANCRSKSKNVRPLSVTELNTSLTKLIRFSQQESFPEDYQTLNAKRELPNNSKILNLHPFMDDQGILRVGGRLTNSDFPYSKKYPILLSPSHRLTQLIFEFEHVNLLHAGPQLLLSNIRDTFWPISGRNLARKIVRNCIKCARYNEQRIQPIMGDLPQSRVRPSLPFSTIGVDYAGPFIMKDKRVRGYKPLKCWVALFVCFVTRAVHLELVLSLSSADFLQAFNRFVSRRGKPSVVYSDNGTNFIKANKELREMGEFLRNNSSTICEATANMSITWHFIPTNSPHFGGIWEAGVKSLKHHLKRVMGCHSLFFFDFQTLLIRIEAVLNSRPLSPMSASPDDLTPLMPSHFLIGKQAVSLPEPSVSSIPENCLSNYQLLLRLYEHFWLRWSREYISELQLRQRWKQNHGQLEKGQLVLVKDDNLPPTRWRLGRVEKLILGKDGIARVASLRTSDGIICRALARLC
nr:unnamed protein product [Callosobruchus chinensis]